MEKQSFFKSKVGKGILVAVFTMLMGVPLIFVQNLVNERQLRKNVVVSEVMNQWSHEQQIGSIVLQVPYIESVKNERVENGKVVVTMVRENRLLFINPESSKVVGNIMPERRKKSIYNVIVYQGNFKINGSFDPIDLPNKEVRSYSVEKAKVLFAVNDIRGLQKEIAIKLNDKTIKMQNSEHNGYLGNSIDLTNMISQKIDFSFDLSMRGSSSIKFNPSAANTDIELTSAWKDPGFFGAFLPTYTINKEGFKAHWGVLELNRDFPRMFYDLKALSVPDYEFGVNLVETANNYQKNERAVKYGLLIIGLTFLVFFFIEVLMSFKINLIQYGLIGIALILFYTLLLSISEFLTFNFAYAISSVATIGLIFMFAKSLFVFKQPALGLAALLTVLYSFIFIIIQLEDTALLIGSIGLFLILAATMYISRKVNWEG